MRLTPLLFALPLLAAACAPVDPSEPGEAELPDAAADDDDEDAPPAWDASPPQVDEGTVAVAVLNCGMLNGTSDVYFEFDGERWWSVERVDHDLFEGTGAVELGDGTPWPEVETCFRRGDDRELVWSGDGRLQFFNGQWLHDLTPTALEDRWLGTVSPMFDDLPQSCLDGVASLGLEIPVTLSVEIVGYVD